MGKEERASPLPSLDWRLGLDTGPLGMTRMMGRFAEEDGGVLSLPWKGLQDCHWRQWEVPEGSAEGPRLSSGPRDTDRVGGRAGTPGGGCPGSWVTSRAWFQFNQRVK